MTGVGKFFSRCVRCGAVEGWKCGGAVVNQSVAVLGVEGWRCGAVIKKSVDV